MYPLSDTVHRTSLIFHIPRVIMLYGNRLHCWLNMNAGSDTFFPSLCLLSVLTPCSLAPRLLVYWEWEEWHEPRGKRGCQLFIVPFCTFWMNWMNSGSGNNCLSQLWIHLPWWLSDLIEGGAPKSKTKQCVREGTGACQWPLISIKAISQHT